MKEIIKVEGMTCSCCVGKVEKSIQQLGDVSSIEIDVDKEEVQVDFNEDTVTLDQVKKSIEAEGYKVI